MTTAAHGNRQRVVERRTAENHHRDARGASMKVVTKGEPTWPTRRTGSI